MATGGDRPHRSDGDGDGDGPTVNVRPQTLMLTFLGWRVLGRGIAVFSGSYVTVMERMGVSAEATRSTLTRMVNRGLLVRHRSGRKMYFGLSPRAADVLREGERRLWHTGAVNLADDDRWTMLGFSLPESRRDDRHQLRSLLRWAGFGLLRSGLWIAPGVVDVASLLPDRRLLDHVVAFRAEPMPPTDIGRVVRDAYDLEAVAARYHRFLRRWDVPEPLPAAPDALARLLWLLSEWLLVLRDDPRLPLRLLPADWPAAAAQKVFLDHHAALRPGARRVAATMVDLIELAGGE